MAFSRSLLRPARAMLLLMAVALSGCMSVLDIGGGSGTGVTGSASSQVATIRKAQGLPALRADRGLEAAAIAQASNMQRAGRMSHDTGRGRDFATRMRGSETGGAAAENIAYGRFDLDAVMSVWMNSAGHRKNILDPRFGRFGLAYVNDPKDPARRYWAMVLAR
jgi:uncharacterized protein YkwD